MAVSCGDLLTDLKESRYFQVWCIMWAVVSIVFFIGFGNVTTVATQNSLSNPATLYRLQEQDASKSGLFFPAIQASTLSTNNSISILACNDANEQVVNVIPSTTSSGQPAFTIQAQTVLAKPTATEIACLVILAKNKTENVSQRIRLAFSDTGSFANAETIYVSADTWGTVYLQKTVFASPSSTSSYYNPWHISHKLSANYTGSMQLYFTMNDFIVPTYQATSAYGSWQAYADIGGMLMFAYVMHSILLFIIGTFLANDSRVLGGARASYENVH